MEFLLKGNELFKWGKIIEAEKEYNKALECEDIDQEDYNNNNNNVRFRALSNRSLMRLKNGNLKGCIEDCNLCLEIDDRNWKVWMRLVVAHEELNELDKSLDVLDCLISKIRGKTIVVDMSTLKQTLQKRELLKKSLKSNVSAKLSESESRAMFSEDHTLRLNIAESTQNGYILVGTQNIKFNLYVANEFGLYNKGVFHKCDEISITPSASTIGSSDDVIIPLKYETGGFKLDKHGRSLIKFQVDIPPFLTGLDIQFKFTCNDKKVVDVLSMPLRVVERKEQMIIEDRYGFHVSCCREMKIQNISIKLLECSGEMGIPGKLWDGASKLSEYICGNKQQLEIKGKSVLELGAGTGAVGLAMDLVLAAKSVTITDLASVIPLIKANIILNNSKRSKAKVLEWGEKLDKDQYDIVVMSDVVYDPLGYQPLIDTLIEICTENKHCIIIWSHRHRNPEDHLFFKLLVESGFTSRLLSGKGVKFLTPNQEHIAKMFLSGDQPPLLDSHLKKFESNDISIYETKLF